jgi:hypothetical protein
VFSGGIGGAGYLRDITAGVTYDLAWEFASAAMTPDGYYVAFSGNLPNSSFNSPYEFYVWDSQAAHLVYTNTTLDFIGLNITTNGQWLAYSINSSLPLLNWPSNEDQVIVSSSDEPMYYYQMSFSSDARYLAYCQAGVGLNTSKNVFLYDCQTGSNQLVSALYYSTNAADGQSLDPAISADGRFVVYESTADDLVPDTSRLKQVHLFDRVTGTTTLLSYSALNAAPGNFISEAPVFTGDGQTIVFQSFASDLVTNDFNGGGDLFVVQLSATNAVANPTNSALVQINQLVYPAGPSGSTGTSPTLSWSATTGASCQVWYKDNLTDPAWQPLNGSITILGNRAQAVDLAPNSGHRFYTIVGN